MTRCTCGRPWPRLTALARTCRLCARDRRRASQRRDLDGERTRRIEAQLAALDARRRRFTWNPDAAVRPVPPVSC